MQIMTSVGILRGILKTCYKNGFFCLQSDKDLPLVIQYGPLGSLFRRNICKEWLASVINNADANMLPIEIKNSKSSSKPFFSKSANSVLPDVFENYFKTLPLFGTSPRGFAAYGSSLNFGQSANNSETSQNSSILKKLKFKDSLCVVFFCPFKKSSEWFNYWARYRYRWWRKFSSIPSKFVMSDVSETELGDQQISLLMEFPWGSECLETITMHGNNFFEKCCQALDLDPKENLNLNVIVCESELNLAAFAYLSNSFAEKWRNQQMRRLLQLNTKLAPYKVCISIRGDNLDDLNVLDDVAKHLEKDLKKYHVAIYPCLKQSIKNTDSHFSRYDEMGIPYSVILDKNALHSGIALLRNRDTTLEEQVHVTELTSKLLKYLQMKPFVV